MQESVDNAVKDAADALDKSNTAVENSNKAVEDAGFANDTANDAKVSADDATNKAAEALNNANNALTNASQAQKDANIATSKAAEALNAADNAQDDATNALGNSNTAISNAQDALNKYNNLNIGGRNYLLNSRTFEFHYGINNSATVTIEDYDQTTKMAHIIIPEGTGATSGIYFKANDVLEAGTNWGLSADMKGVGTASRFWLETSTSVSKADWKLTENWVRYSTTGISAKENQNFVIYFDATKGAVDAYIKLIKVEKSTKPSDWSPAPEDVQVQITNINGELSQKVSQTTYNTLAGTVDTVSTLAKQNQSTIGTLATKTSVDTVNKTATTAQTLAQQNANELLNKASTNTVDTLTQRVTTAESTLSQTATKAELQVAQTNVDNLKKTVTSNTAGMTANANAIKLKADSSTVSDLDGRVTSLSGQLDVQSDLISAKVTASDVTGMLGNYATQSWSEGKISAAKNEISASVQNITSDMATQTWTQGKLDLTADGLTSQISSVKTDLKNLAIGGRNYFSVSGFAANKYAFAGIDFYDLQLLPNTKYTVSTTNVGIPAQGWANVFVGNKGFTPASGGNGVIVNKPRTVTTDNTGVLTVAARNYSLADGKDKIQVELGAVATLWQPAPEDMATAVQFTSLEQTLKGVQITANNAITQGQLSLLSDQLTSTITGVKNDLDNMQIGGRNYILNSGQTITINGDTDHYKILYYNLTPGTWTFSANAKYTRGTDTGVLISVTNAAQDKPEYSKTAQLINGKITATFTVTDVAKQVLVYASSNADTAGKTLTLDHYKLEQGNKSTDWSPAPEDQATVVDVSSQITQLQNDVNLRVQKGDVINQINVDGSGVLIAGQKVHITGQTTIDNAVIKDAMIANLSASKLTAGTIDAGKINVVNLNASNITTGTITGSNLSINLNTGEILFTKGSIKSTNGMLNINVDDGSFTQTDQIGNGVYFNHGAVNFADADFSWPDTNNDHTYGLIDNYGFDAFGNNLRGLRINGTYGVHLVSGKDNFGFTPLYTMGAGADFDPSHGAVYSEGQMYISGGNVRDAILHSSQIIVGYPLVYPGSYYDWHEDPDKGVYDTGTGMVLTSDVIQFQGTRANNIFSNSGRLTLADDAKSAYIMSMMVYSRTYSSGATMTVTQNGVFGRISSASKYKLDISTVNNITEQAHAFLAVEPKQWFDKAETEDMAKELTEGDSGSVDSANVRPYYGYVAEDLYSAGLDNVVLRDSNTGELEGIQYDRLTIYHHELIRELYQRVNDLEAKIYSMEANK